jgi:HK97 family phage major capsid protein
MEVLEAYTRLHPQQPVRQAPAKNVALGLTPKEVAKYSVARVLTAFYDKTIDASYERTLTEDCWKRMGRPGTPFADTVILPYEVVDVVRQQRDLSVASGGGGFLIEDRIPMLADAQRPRNLVRRAGATYLTGLKANQSIPRVNATATGAWLSTEAAQPAESQQTIVSVPLMPRTYSVYVERSRLLWLMAPELSERAIRSDLYQIAEGALDVAALAGTGTSQPQGIIGTSGVGSFTGASIAWAGVLEAQSDVLNANALASPTSFAYVTTPSVAELLAKRQGFSSTAPMWIGGLDEGTLAGARAFTSTNVPAATIVAGDWSQLVVAEYGPGIEIRINPAANFQAGIIGFALDYTCDCAVTFPTAFSVATSVS